MTKSSFPHELTDLLRRTRIHSPERIAFRFVGQTTEPTEEITYGELDRRACRLAAELTRRGLAQKRVLLAFDPGLDFVVAFVAAVYAGVTAVPVYPPDPFRLHRTLERLQKIVDDAQAEALLTTSNLAPLCTGILSTGSSATGSSATGSMSRASTPTIIATDTLPSSADQDWQIPAIAGNALALLQYTSGSTDDPKGVMVTRDNLVCNLRQIHERLDRPNAVTASWLPVYHDMGLLAGVLQPLHSGRISILMSPLAFFQNPLRWLQVISDYHVTATVSPDFGYEVCVRKTTPEQRAGLDLRHWQIAMNGSEPVRHATMEQFLEAFVGNGLRTNVFLPCYGLAEATLFVAGGDPEESPFVATFDADQLAQGRAVETNDSQRRRALVSSGRGVSGQQLLIVDPESRAIQPDNTIGEIWVAGGHVAAGYWRRDAETRETFLAQTADGVGPFLRTGDTGFLHSGHLFVTGRIKDIVIVSGRNHYPHDIERTVEGCDPALKTHGGAVFSVDDGQQERIVVVHEVLRPNQIDQQGILAKIATAVAYDHQIAVDAIVLIKSGTLPKTTSGKTRRRKCRELYLQNRLSVVTQWQTDRKRRDRAELAQNYVAPRTSTEEILATIWSEVLGLERVGVHDNFFDLGGQSLLASQIATRLAGWLPQEIALSSLFDRPTIAQLATWIEELPVPCDDPADLADLLQQVDALTEDEVHSLLRQDSALELPRLDASSPRRGMKDICLTPLDLPANSVWHTSSGVRDDRVIE